MLKHWRLGLVLLVGAVAVASTTTTNMSLVVPSTGDTDYPTSISTSMSLIDAHDHTTGKGVQIPAGGIASNAVTSAKIAAAVAGDGITGGAGTALAVNTDGSTLEISSDAVRIKDGAVTQAKLAARATGTTVAAGGVAISASSSTFSTSSTSWTDVTNLTVTITTTGRPVVLMGITDGTGVYPDGSFIGLSGSAATNHYAYINWDRGGSSLGVTQFGGYTSGSGNPDAPPSIINMVDFPAAGTYTYKLQVRCAGTSTISVYRTKIVAYEL